MAGTGLTNYEEVPQAVQGFLPSCNHLGSLVAGIGSHESQLSNIDHLHNSIAWSQEERDDRDAFVWESRVRAGSTLI